MEILTGLFEHMVLQQVDGASAARIAGTCHRDGTIIAYVTADELPLPDFVNVEVGVARDGQFQADLIGIPAGGPYTVQLSVSTRSGKWLESVIVPDVLVGDVWLLAGQSNMQGVGLLVDAAPADPLIRCLTLDDRWGVARDPLHDYSIAAAPVHRALCGGVLPPRNTVTGVGPGIAFAAAMLAQRRVPQGLIASAHGGTTMTQWDPARRDEGGHSLYGATLARVRRNGGRIAGMLWYQGESDANAQAAPLYTSRMIALVQALRADLAASELPIAVVQLSRTMDWNRGSATHWLAIQEQQRLLPNHLPHLTVVPAIDLSLDDAIHISGRDQQLLGRRLADAMQTLTGQGPLPPPMALRGITMHPTERGMTTLEVAFDHVVDGLRAGSRPWGFRVGQPDPVHRVIDVRLAGDRAFVRTGLSGFEAECATLYYGGSFDPYCNITDGAGRSLPAFGPLIVSEPRAMTPPVRHLLVSPILPGAGDLTSLACPERIDLAPRQFESEFCNRHDDLQTVAPGDDRLVYFAGTLTCPEAMALSCYLGYDGPVKAWLNGRQIHHDPRGTNPALPDKAKIPLTLDAGEHRLLVALSANGGRAWGIFLRFVRTDLAREVVAAGDYRLPTFAARW